MWYRQLGRSVDGAGTRAAGNMLLMAGIEVSEGGVGSFDEVVDTAFMGLVRHDADSNGPMSRDAEERARLTMVYLLLRSPPKAGRRGATGDASIRAEVPGDGPEFDVGGLPGYGVIRGALF